MPLRISHQSRQNHYSKPHQILVVWDKTPVSDTALRYAMDMCKVLEAKITVFYPVKPQSEHMETNPMNVLDALNENNQHIQAELLPVRLRLEYEGINHAFHFGHAGPREEIQICLNQLEPDLVVVGKTNKAFGAFVKVKKYLVTEYKGSVLAVGKKDRFEDGANFGVFGGIGKLSQAHLHTLFQIDDSRKVPMNRNRRNTQTTTDQPYLMELSASDAVEDESKQKQAPISIENLQKQVIDRDLKLICISRSQTVQAKSFWSFARDPLAWGLLKKIDIPVMLIGSCNPAPLSISLN